MATIYRFIIEQKVTQTGSGRNPRNTSTSKSGAAKKGRMVSIFSGDKGGVEHNRKMRAINPLINRATGGAWEKGMRVGRAGLGLIQKNTETGAIGISPVAIAIIISFVIQTILKWQKRDMEIARKENTQNYRAMENGIGGVHSQYEISVNIWNGKVDYNENK